MRFSQLVAFRYLHASRENRYFSWITLLSLLGLAIGVAALIVVLSVINGFEYELRNRFLQANAHIMAYRYPAGMVNPDKWASMIMKDKDFAEDVQGISPFVHYETMAKNENVMQGVLVRGIDPIKREKVQSIASLIDPPNALSVLQKEIEDKAKGKPEPEIPSVIIGIGLMETLKSKIGGTIHLVAPSENNRFSDMKRFKIAGTYNSGLKHYDNRLIILSLTTAQSFFNMKDTVTGIEIGLKDADLSPEVARKMEQKYELSFREWQSYNRPLFEAMERERFVIAIIVAMVVIVAGFNILTTVFVSVSQRQRDISILKALGSTNGQIMKLFLIQSSCIGFGGAALGVVLAGMISFVLERYPFIDLPEPYFLKSLPVHYSLPVYATVCLAAIAICLLAGLYPAFIASRVTPTEGIGGIGAAIT
ncbi:MAG: ABC transporter permease [Proteobacteria bacterium]|nr:MAG: ABC transporter permease [Pseudomonadota bacterium]